LYLLEFIGFYTSDGYTYHTARELDVKCGFNQE